MTNNTDFNQNGTSRRTFLAGSAIAGAGLMSTDIASAASGYHNQHQDKIKVGLIGCGGRGTGAAINAMNADSNVVVTALADTFSDRMKDCHQSLLGKEKVQAQVQIPDENFHEGFDGYKKLIDKVDVVLLCTPPYFRPAQLRYAIEQGKHVFCEKPVAVDGPGLRHVLESCKMAKEKNLNIVSGLCWRYDVKVNEMIKRIQDGEIGDVMAIQENYLTSTLWYRQPSPDWTPMHHQVRNWLYYTWLSGDLTAEQHIHSLDKALWLRDDKAPEKCVGLGGRQVRTQPHFGNVFDHFACYYEWEDGFKTFSYARQMAGCKNSVDDFVIGTKGRAEVLRGMLTFNDGKRWKYRGRNKSMYDLEHVALFKSIRNGDTINNGEYMVNSTLMAIMGREASYTGQEVTSKQIMESNVSLGPKEVKWGPCDPGEIALPGKKKGKKVQFNFGQPEKKA